MASAWSETITMVTRLIWVGDCSGWGLMSQYNHGCVLDFRPKLLGGVGFDGLRISVPRAVAAFMRDV
jgi:hypothetical protein